MGDQIAGGEFGAVTMGMRSGWRPALARGGGVSVADAASVRADASCVGHDLRMSHLRP